MRGATHSLAGGVSWLAVCTMTGASPALAVVGGLTAAAAAPWCDLDNLGTWSRRRPGLLINWRTHPVKSRVAEGMSLFGTHRRGPCHSLTTAPAAVALLLLAPMLWWAWWPWWAAAAAALGVASHPVLDLLNTRPVQILWPGRWLVYGLPKWARIRVGSAGEVAVAVLLGIAAALLAVVYVRGLPA